MKKSYIALTVLAMAALVSCQENEVNFRSLEDGEIGFYLKGSMTTKAGDASASIKGVTIPLGTDEMGNSLILEQVITTLDAFGPETKGTPAYTDNVVSLYGGKFNATVVGKNGVFNSNGEFVYDGTSGKFVNKYKNDLWDNAALTFYMWMPGDLGKAVNAGNGIADSDLSGGTISFSYDGSKLLAASADSVLAKDMKDILFTSRSFSGKGTGATEYNEEEGAEILFHHALAGVKFASGNDASDDSKIKINEVIFRNLLDRGTCEITGQKEGTAYKDIPTNYSSATAAVWEQNTTPSGTSYSTGAISGFADYSQSSYTFPDSFTANGKDGKSTGARNLNDNDATQTLWIMPQTITAGVKLTIKYTVDRDGDGTYDEPGVWTIDFGEYLSKTNTNIEFKAGQLHTFYIKIDDVNVMIEDKLSKTSQTAPETYDTKSDVVITNTGSVDAYIRASIIGQWLDDDQNPVFGFTDYVSHFETVDSWYNDQFGTGNRSHGTFVGLPGYNGGANPNATQTAYGWKLCPDGFYYYTEVVPSGEATEGALFDSYTVSDTFDKSIEVGSKTFPIHFQLEISTQAVSAKMPAEKNNKTNYTWNEAWERAIGYDPEVGPGE